jgi:hypothetical protein
LFGIFSKRVSTAEFFLGGAMLRSTLALLVLLSLCQSVSKAQVADGVEAYRMMYERDQAIKQARFEWNQAKKIASTPAQTLAAKNEKPSQPIEIIKMEAGAVGQVHNTVFTVVSVVDAKNVLSSDKTGMVIWLQNCDTTNLVDDEKVVVVGLVRCGGAREYVSAIGSDRKVKAIEFLPEAEQKEFEEAARLAQYKPFRLRNGTVLKAKITETSPDKITLETIEGKTQSYLWTAFDNESQSLLPKRPTKKPSRSR